MNAESFWTADLVLSLHLHPGDRNLQTRRRICVDERTLATHLFYTKRVMYTHSIHSCIYYTCPGNSKLRSRRFIPSPSIKWPGKHNPPNSLSVRSNACCSQGCIMDEMHLLNSVRPGWQHVIKLHRNIHTGSLEWVAAICMCSIRRAGVTVFRTVCFGAAN